MLSVACEIMQSPILSTGTPFGLTTTAVSTTVPAHTRSSPRSTPACSRVDEGDVTLFLARLTDEEPDLVGPNVPDDATRLAREL